MARICIDTRDELRIINLDDVLFLRASGNYTNVYMSTGKEISITACLSAIEKRIAEADSQNCFLRINRSYMVNTGMVQAVSLTTGKITFTPPTSSPLS